MRNSLTKFFQVLLSSFWWCNSFTCIEISEISNSEKILGDPLHHRTIFIYVKSVCLVIVKRPDDVTRLYTVTCHVAVGNKRNRKSNRNDAEEPEKK